MSEDPYARKLAEADHLINDPDVPLCPARIWLIMEQIAEHAEGTRISSAGFRVDARRDQHEPKVSWQVGSGEDKAMGSQYPGNCRSDDQLAAILFETATWTINGRNGQVLCSAPSLRVALDRAADFAASGAVVVAICRTPGDTIVVFDAQAKRLRNM